MVEQSVDKYAPFGQLVYALPALGERLPQTGLNLLIGTQGELSGIGDLSGGIRGQNVLDHGVQVFADGCDRPLDAARFTPRGVSHHAFRRTEALDHAVALGLGPFVGAVEGVHTAVIEALIQHTHTLGLGIDDAAHVHHAGEHQQSRRGFRLVRMDKGSADEVRPLAAQGVEKLADRAVPLHYGGEGGQLVALEELLDGGLYHPIHTVVIDQNDLTEAIVPQAKHYIDQRVHDGLLAGHHCAGHAQVVIGVAAVVDRGQCEGYLMAGLGGLPADGLADGAAHEGVQAGVVVDAVVLRTANGDQDNIIFSSICITTALPE